MELKPSEEKIIETLVDIEVSKNRADKLSETEMNLKELDAGYPATVEVQRERIEEEKEGDELIKKKFKTERKYQNARSKYWNVVKKKTKKRLEDMI